MRSDGSHSDVVGKKDLLFRANGPDDTPKGSPCSCRDHKSMKQFAWFSHDAAAVQVNICFLSN